MIKNRIHKSDCIFILFLLAFCALFVFVESNNGRLWTHDFKVYYDATHDFFSGNNPYKHNYGLDSGFFKYTPFTLYLFSPQLFFSYPIGQIIHLLLLTASLSFSLLNFRYILERHAFLGNQKVNYGFLYLLFASTAILITRELHLGNINLILVLLFNMGIRALFNNQKFWLSVWWSLMIVLKPIMILTIIPLIVTKQWKTLFTILGFGIFFFLVPSVHIGLSGNYNLWKDWFTAISRHENTVISYNTISAIVFTISGFKQGWLFTLAILLSLVAWMLKDFYRKGSQKPDIILVWSAIFTAFIPNFFVTDTEHFLLSIPLIWLLFAALVNNGKWFYWVFFFIGMLCFSFQSSDLLGPLSDFVYQGGFLGIGNLIFISTFLCARNERIL